MSRFESSFPAIRGIQAGREYYVTMCPLKLVPRILSFNEEELKPELRAQRVLNKARIPEMTRYILGGEQDYVFSSLTASIDGGVDFEPAGDGEEERDIGRLRIPMEARVVINDGQHRRAAIEAALRENPDLGDETISVVFFIDVGLKRCQQMFADLNRHAVRPAKSLGILYEHRDEAALVTKGLLQKVSLFRNLTELERSSISNRSLKLFTLSGIHNATQTLLSGLAIDAVEDKLGLAVSFWNEVGKQMPDWQLAHDRSVSTAELRRDYIHSHTLALVAIARVGNQLLANHKRGWKTKLAKLKTIDWSRNNRRKWEGRAMNAGRLSKRRVNVALTANAIKQHLGLKLTEEERKLEGDLRRNGIGTKR